MEKAKNTRFSIRFFSFILSSCLIVSALFILFFTYRLLLPDKKGETSVTYEIMIPGVSAEIANGIGVGDLLTDSVSKAALGTVTDVRLSACRTEAVDSGHRLRLYNDEKKKDVTLTLTASADGSLAVGGHRMLAGETLYLRLPAYTGSGICIKRTEVIP